jgi:hypothetical protein
MKPQNIVLAFMLMAGAASLSVAAAEWPPISQRPSAAPAEYDFTALHRQASAALAELRQSQERRLASAENPVF